MIALNIGEHLEARYKILYIKFQLIMSEVYNDIGGED